MSYKVYIKETIGEGFTTREEAEEFAYNTGIQEDDDKILIIEGVT